MSSKSEKILKYRYDISAYEKEPITIMEVCGTHTERIATYGIKQLLPKQVRIVSGPGCPVCVTEEAYLYQAKQFVLRKDCIVVSFGDVLRIPFGLETLMEVRGQCAGIRIVYTPFDCITIAKQNKDKKIIFLSVGFETTTPLVALLLEQAIREHIDNLYVYMGNKSIVPAMEYLLEDKQCNISAFLYPGHVAAVTGAGLFDTFSNKYRIKGVVCGFDLGEILHALCDILYGNQLFYNDYERVVSEKGNKKAAELMEQYFVLRDGAWRGFGILPKSSYELREEFRSFDARILLKEEEEICDRPKSVENSCSCKDVLKGLIEPKECKLFYTDCTPFHPVGPCMVSREGACAIEFKNRGVEDA